MKKTKETGLISRHADRNPKAAPGMPNNQYLKTFKVRKERPGKGGTWGLQ
jgi:hypothetical protein